MLFAVMLLAALSAALPARAGVDWAAGTLTARAVEPVDPDPFAPTGDPAVALRKAALAARKGLWESLAALRFDADSSVGDLLARDQSLAGRVRGLLQNSPIQGGEVQTEAGRAQEATASAALAGTLLEVLMPPARVQFQSGVPPRRTLAPGQPLLAPSLGPLQEGAAPAPLLLPAPEAPAAAVSAAGYTGLMVDARHLSVVPALLPVLFDPSGTGIYGAFLVPRASALASRLALYAASAEDEAVRQRCGAKPLLVRAVGLAGPSGVDLVLPAAESGQVRALLHNNEVLSRCAVAILWTPPQPVTGPLSPGPGAPR
jgi:hypothetical protein